MDVVDDRMELFNANIYLGPLRSISSQNVQFVPVHENIPQTKNVVNESETKQPSPCNRPSLNMGCVHRQALLTHLGSIRICRVPLPSSLYTIRKKTDGGL